MLNLLANIRSNGTDYESIQAGVCTGPNTFGTKTLQHLEALQPAFAMDLPIHRHADTDLGGDPIAGVQLARMAKSEWQEQATHALTNARSGVITVESIGGSGYLAHSLGHCPEKVVRPVVNVIVGSHRLTGNNGGPQPVEAVTAALSYPQINRGTILLSNRAVEEGYGTVPKQVAEFVASLVRHDLADLETGFYTGWHESIPTNGLDQFNVGTLLAQARQNGSCWFDPDEFLWWKSSEELPAFENDVTSTQVFGLLPPDYDQAAVQNVNATIRSEFVEGLDSAHLVVLKTLNEEWIEELRRGPDWVRRQVEIGGNRYASRWAGLADKHGLGDDPMAALEQFRGTHLA
jgi:hypothetical protein